MALGASHCKSTESIPQMNRTAHTASSTQNNEHSANNNDQNLYDILGVPYTATREEIEREYRKKAHAAIKTNDAKQMQLLNQAHSILIDPDARAFYNRFGNGALSLLEMPKEGRAIFRFFSPSVLFCLTVASFFLGLSIFAAWPLHSLFEEFVLRNAPVAIALPFLVYPWLLAYKHFGCGSLFSTLTALIGTCAEVLLASALLDGLITSVAHCSCVCLVEALLLLTDLLVVQALAFYNKSVAACDVRVAAVWKHVIRAGLVSLFIWEGAYAWCLRLAIPVAYISLSGGLQRTGRVVVAGVAGLLVGGTAWLVSQTTEYWMVLASCCAGLVYVAFFLLGVVIYWTMPVSGIRMQYIGQIATHGSFNPV